MTVAHFMSLLGGLALFLYGMQMMSTGLEAAAGNRMKSILERLTANRFIGVLVGALITAVIQSSSATTVMVVGFVNSGMMTLSQAVWIIMGANIGTTITGQLIALDIGAIAPLIAFLGVAVIVFLKNEKLKHIGKIMAGLGVLFIGMDMMSGAMKPLADSEAFIRLLTKFENPLLGILAGTVFTALIQSSSASVGILQALANSGVIGLGSAAFVLFGQNIGTCITAMLASVGTSRNAKRTTLIHVMFNVFGTIVFTFLCLLTPILSMVRGWTPQNPSAQIANLHTLFNVVTTILLLPVGSVLTKIAAWILKDKEEKEEDSMKALYLLDIERIHAEKLGASLICLEGIKKEIARMMEMARRNVFEAFAIFARQGGGKFHVIEQREEYVDFLNREISKYITAAASYERTKKGSRIYNALFSITGNIERISDHAMNIAEYSEMMEEKQIVLSKQAKVELEEMRNLCEKMFRILAEDKPEDVTRWHGTIAAMEQEIDDMTIRFRDNMYDRIHEGQCSNEGGILFSEMLTDFERVGDHALNIADEMLKISSR